MKLEITYDDRDLVVIGTYHKGYAATMIDPGQHEHFAIDRVFDADVEVSHLFSDRQWESLAELALEAYSGEQEYAREQAAEWRREERMLGIA